MNVLAHDVTVLLTKAGTDLPTITAQTVLALAGFVSVVGGAIALVVAGTRTGLGWLGLLPWSRRRRLARALRRLDVGLTLDAFGTTLDRKPIRVARDGADLLHTFDCGDVEVVARTDPDQAVTEYTVVAVNPKFTPKVNLTPNSGNPLVVQLGRTRFADAGTPNAIGGFLGASDYGYNELHYHGRPGGYRYFRLGSNASDGQPPDEFFAMLRGVTFTDDDTSPFGDTPALADARVYAARAATTVTTYSVLADVPDRVWT